MSVSALNTFTYSSGEELSALNTFTYSSPSLSPLFALYPSPSLSLSPSVCASSVSHPQSRRRESCCSLTSRCEGLQKRGMAFTDRCVRKTARIAACTLEFDPYSQYILFLHFFRRLRKERTCILVRHVYSCITNSQEVLKQGTTEKHGLTFR